MRTPSSSSRARRAFALTLVLAAGVLATEALLPADRQPIALLVRGAIGVYQTHASPLVAASGVRCRYSPTCSHYAAEAVERRGTVVGLLQAGGRLLRCGPWGGRGHDPVVAAAAVFQAEQETPEQRRQREDMEKAAREFEKAAREFEEHGKEAAVACGVGILGCVVVSLVGLAVTVFVMVWVFKDAKARGDQNAVLWLVLIFFLSWIGLIVYLVARPKGDLTPCSNCQQKKLHALVKCPHCGADVAPAKG